MQVDNNTIIGLMRATSGFLAQGPVGAAITITYPNSTTEVYTFSGGMGGDYAITLVYTDSSKANLSTATRSS